MVMICAQLMAFGRVHRLREESKERRRLKKEYAEAGKVGSSGKVINRANGHAVGHSTTTISPSGAHGSIKRIATKSLSTTPEESDGCLQDTDRYSPDTGEESEVIL